MRGPTNYRGVSLTRFNFDIGGRWTLLTGIIIFASAALFVYGYANRTSGEIKQAPQMQPYKSFALYETLALKPTAFLKGELWRFLSSVFLHANFMQLLCSAFLLYLFGAYLAHRLGNLLFFLSFLICGIAAGAVSLILSPQEISLCASAAALGICTLCILHFPYLRFFRSVSAKQLLLPAIALTLLSSATFTRRDILLLGHLTAVAMGFLLYELEPLIRSIISRRRLRREITVLFSEAQKEEELDRILKKVTTCGLDGLTQLERRFLQSMSSQYQKKKIE
jgi:membrane associated rhomboid family serine protease